MNIAEMIDRPATGPAAAASRRGGGAGGPGIRQKPVRKSKKARAFWLKQLHAWHWMSAAISLAGMLLFAVTGITLNHAAAISATPSVVAGAGALPHALLQRLPAPNEGHAALPADVARAVASATAIDPAGHAADWTAEDEIYVAMPGPGRDAWVSIDRASGAITAERTDRGWVSYLNDLHKGRNTGSAWSWFIDLFAVACVIFTLTGLFLLQLHARHRPSTWPLAGLSLVLPVVLAAFFIH